MKDFEEIGKEMPYRMPEHFIEDITERVVSKASVRQSTVHVLFPKVRKSVFWVSIASAAAIALLLLVPFVASDSQIPDYDSISQCKSIDEVFQSMSADDLGLYSMMSNYYGE
ncbi:MAG: hypothetical protein J5732_03655 [Bacteroidaceae bacterium]|nr:hypothetical protein [Bacteroidaceae bacterium]